MAMLVYEYDRPGEWSLGKRNEMEPRMWLVGGPPVSSYLSERYSVSVYVRSGSPPKGYVVLSPLGAVAFGPSSKVRVYYSVHSAADYRREHDLARRMPDEVFQEARTRDEYALVNPETGGYKLTAKEIPPGLRLLRPATESR